MSSGLIAPTGWRTIDSLTETILSGRPESNGDLDGEPAVNRSRVWTVRPYGFVLQHSRLPDGFSPAKLVRALHPIDQPTEIKAWTYLVSDQLLRIHNTFGHVDPREMTQDEKAAIESAYNEEADLGLIEAGSEDLKQLIGYLALGVAKINGVLDVETR